jgi:hypothetical protein
VRSIVEDVYLSCQTMEGEIKEDGGSRSGTFSKPGWRRSELEQVMRSPLGSATKLSYKDAISTHVRLQHLDWSVSCYGDGHAGMTSSYAREFVGRN